MRPVAVKPDLTMQTHDAIRAAIISGELSPCAPLAQEELAAQLGVSRQPVSHALILLKREGLVVDRGRKGQMVAPIDADKLLAQFQVRGAMDGLAARLAAGQGPVNLDACKKQFESLLKAGETAIAAGDLEQLVNADIAFHQAIHDLSCNPEIAEMTKGSWFHMARSMRVVLSINSARLRSWADHKAIAEAILSGNSDAAQALATEHAEHAGRSTYARLTEETKSA